MHNTELVQENAESNNVEVVWQKITNFSTAEKAELVKRLLGKESGLILVSTSSHLVDYIIAQMSLLSSEGLSYIMTYALREIAARLDWENDRSRN
jgi:hypothetical protein